MATETDIFTSLAVLAPLSAGCIGVMAWRGWLRPDALQRAPRRRLGLGPFDIVVALAVWAFGLLAAGQTLHALDVSMIETEGPITTDRDIVLTMLVGQALTSGVVALYLFGRCATQAGGLQRIGLIKRRAWLALPQAALAVLLVWPVMALVTVAAQWIGLQFGDAPEAVGHTMLKRMLDMEGTHLLWAMVSAVVVAPLLEEVMYRGLLQSTLVNMTGHRWRLGMVALTSVAFTTIHLSAVQWQALPGLFLLSMALGWLYERTRNLWACICMHALFNAGNVGLAFVMFANDA